MKSENTSWRKAYYILISIICIALLQPKGGTWAWTENVRWLYVFILSFSLTQFFTPIVIKLAWFFKILDIPDNARKLHSKPIPRIGGLAIFIAILISAVRNYQFSIEFTGLLIGSSIIYILGFIDDVHPLSAKLRLAIQVLASFIVIKCGIVVSFIPKTWPAHIFIAELITIIWLIGLANAINFMDGVDGLASSMLFISSFFFFLIAWPSRQSYVAYLTITAAGACLGFLPYNWKPANTFLGDAGATFLGFLIAGLAIMGSWAHNNPIVAFSTPLLILGIPIFDMIYTTISRIKKGYVHNFKEWLEYAGRDHFHHRLMRINFSEKQTVFFIILVNLCLGLGALVIRDTGTKGSLLILLQAVAIFFIIITLMILGRHKNTEAPIKHHEERS